MTYITIDNISNKVLLLIFICILAYFGYSHKDFLIRHKFNVLVGILGLLILYILIEKLMKVIHMAKSSEGFVPKSCGSCAVKPEPVPTKSCRMVCDGDKENFEGFEEVPKQEHKIIAEQVPKQVLHETESEIKNSREESFMKTRHGTNNNPDSEFGGMFYDENPFYNRYNNGEFEDEENYDAVGERNAMESERKVQEAIENRAHDIGGYNTPYQETGAKSEKNKTLRNRRAIEGPLDDELPYSDYNQLPVASGYKSHAYEYGYSFLPPEKWYPQPPRPPVCVTEKRCPVCPGLTTGGATDLMEFNTARRITAPDQINTSYVNDKLNAGR